MEMASTSAGPQSGQSTPNRALISSVLSRHCTVATTASNDNRQTTMLADVMGSVNSFETGPCDEDTTTPNTHMFTWLSTMCMMMWLGSAGLIAPCLRSAV